MNSIKDLIDEYKTKLQDNLATMKTYKTCVSELVAEFSTELKKEPGMNFLKTYLPNTYSDDLDIIIETLVYMYCNNDCVLNRNQELMIFKTYPYLIYNLLYKNNVDTVRSHVKELLELNQKIFGSKQDNCDKTLRLLLDYCYEFENNFKTHSSLYIFKYFYGIDFNKVAVTYLELPKQRFVVNLGFNNECKNVLYNNVGNYPVFMLNENALDKFKLVSDINIMKRDKCYYSNYDSTRDISIVLNYCDDPDDTKCHYSVSYKTFHKDDINCLIHGGTLTKINQSVMDIYFGEMFHRRLKRNVEKNEDVNIELNNISSLIKSFYNQDVKECVNIWLKYKNDKYFKIYLNKLYQYTNEQGFLDYVKYVSHIMNYFIVDTNV